MNIVRSEEWFVQVFNSNFDPLRNYLYYLSGDSAWTDDALQQVFLVVWERRDMLKEETLRPFMFKVARNLFLRQKRRDSVVLKFERLQNDSQDFDTPEQLMESRQFSEQLETALSGLPEKCRTVFLMSRLDEMQNRQIAEALGVSVKAVEKHITRALKILRKVLSIEERDANGTEKQGRKYLGIFF